MKHCIAMFCICAGLNGCAANQGMVIASTATIIGVELGQGQATQAVSGTLGYKRAEFAYVPTNFRASGDQAGKGAPDSADVLMELQYQHIFSGQGGINQRLAVGPNAVAGNSAAVALFSNGNELRQHVAATLAAEAVASKQIVACFTKADGSLDTTKRDAAIAAATAKLPSVFTGNVVSQIKSQATPQALSSYFDGMGDRMVLPLQEALPDECK